MRPRSTTGRTAPMFALAAAVCFAHGAQALPEPPKPDRPSLRGPTVKKPKADLKAVRKSNPVFGPDLVIRSLRLKSYGPCRPGAQVLNFEVVLANIGNAPSSGIGGAGIVSVKERNGAGPWGNGAGLGRQIPPGGQVTMTVGVHYLQSNPRHMVTGAPHRFRAEADPLKRIAEKNENNNHSAVVLVGAPPDCPGADQPRVREQPKFKGEIRKK